MTKTKNSEKDIDELQNQTLKKKINRVGNNRRWIAGKGSAKSFRQGYRTGYPSATDWIREKSEQLVKTKEAAYLHVIET